MRIISVFILIRLALILILPQTALAAEIQETTNTEFIKSGSVLDNEYKALLPYNPDNFKDSIYKNPMSPERAKVIAKRKTNINPAFLPKGKFIINASAYTAAADECGKSDGITASGLKVREHETLACPREFPFGTLIKIEGMGTYVCQDRGGAIKGNHIDIYMETKSEAFAFGRRNLVAEVVN